MPYRLSRLGFLKPEVQSGGTIVSSDAYVYLEVSSHKISGLLQYQHNTTQPSERTTLVEDGGRFSFTVGFQVLIFPRY